MTRSDRGGAGGKPTPPRGVSSSFRLFGLRSWLTGRVVGQRMKSAEETGVTLAPPEMKLLGSQNVQAWGLCASPLRGVGWCVRGGVHGLIAGR